jgi:hypothetical protein
MSRKFLTNIDLNTNLLLNATLQTVTLNTHSAGTTAGALAYSSGRIQIGNGSAAVSTALSTDTITVGSTAITIGGSATTIAGLSSVTSTTFVGALTGNASTATTLATARNINGVSFNGSADITVTAAAGTLSGATLNSGVTASSLTSVGTLTGLTMGGNIAMGNNKITGLGTPTADADAATKLYVDNIAAGVNVHEAVKYATTGALGTTGNLVGGTITPTYSNGTSGVGATLTIATSSNWSAVTIDGQTLTVNDRVLVKDQASALQNGIYTVTSVGAVANTTSFVFTRATDQDASADINAGDLVYVIAGTTNGGDGYVQTITGVTTGTTGIVWTQFSGAGAVPLATITTPGIASFPTAQFSVSGAGAVQIDNLSGALITTGTVADGRIASALTGKTYNALTLTAAATGFTVAGGTTSKTLTVNNTLALSGTDSSTLNIGTGGTLGTAAFTATSAYLAAGVTSLPSVTSVNSTTIPNAATLLVSGGALGTPSSGTLTNATGLPVSTGISGLGTSVATALAVAVGSAGAIVTNGGALGTPSSGTLTNATGLPIGSGVSGLGTGVATFLGTPTSANLRAAISDESGTGAIVFAGGDIGAATATTATAGNSTTLVATTAFVANAVSSSGTKKYTATNASITPSSGTATWTILATTHLIGNTPAIQIQMFEVSSGMLVDADFKVDQTAGSAAPTGDVTISWNASTTVAAATYRIVLIG